MRDEGDGGFSLPELLVGIVLVGMLASALLGVVSVVLRNDDSTAARLAASQDLQQLVVYLPGDVQSAAPGTFVLDPGVASGCGLDDDARNVLAMSWGEGSGAVRVSYRLHGGERGRLVRVACPAASPGTSVTVANDLAPVPGSWSAGSAPVAVALREDGRLVEVRLTTADGSVFPLEAARFATAATLAPVASTAAPPSTTTTTPTTSIPPEDT